jgi:hypothetical protein
MVYEVMQSDLLFAGVSKKLLDPSAIVLLEGLN